MVEELPPSAMVVAKSTEDRILLQALLRIHHVPVVGEGDGAAQALKTLRERRLTHLVVDSDLADGTVAQLVRDALSIAPGLRIVVLGRSSLHTPDLPEGTAGSVVWLTRPFRFSQFAEALGIV
ncbi:MAG TPA: response regulator [Thermoplasmata archaeon]|nr:response regulator [Thermoplasmata archaeon]